MLIFDSNDSNESKCDDFCLACNKKREIQCPICLEICKEKLRSYKALRAEEVEAEAKEFSPGALAGDGPGTETKQKTARRDVGAINNAMEVVGYMPKREDFDQEYLIWCGVLNRDTLLGTCRYVGAPGRAGPTPVSSGTATTLQSLITQSRKTAALFTYNTIEIAPQIDVVIGWIG